MSRGRFQVLLALLRLAHAAAAPSRRHHGHSRHHLKNVTVRVRACDAPIKIANLGYLGPTKMNHLDYFSRAYAQPRYRSAAAPSAGARSRPRAIVRGTRLTDDDSVQLGEHVWGRDLHLQFSAPGSTLDCVCCSWSEERAQVPFYDVSPRSRGCGGYGL